MSTPESGALFAGMSLDAKDLTASAINGIRVALGIGGAVALIIGILITFWPEKSLNVLTVLLGVYLLIAGVAYLGIGIFSKGISGGAKALDIILAVLFVIAGLLALFNIAATRDFLLVFLGLLVGIMWIVEGVVTLVQLGDAPSKAWAIFFAIISILAGIVLLFSPVWGSLVLFWLTGISLIVFGIVQIIRAFTFGRGVARAAAA